MKYVIWLGIAGTTFVFATQARAQANPWVEGISNPVVADDGYVGSVESPTSSPTWSHHMFGARVEAEFAAFNLWGNWIWGGGAELAAGLQFRRLAAIYAQLDFFTGTTETGLRTNLINAGYSCELMVDRFRFGLTAQFAFLLVKRASNDEQMFTLGGVFSADVNVDILQRPHADLYIGISGGGMFFSDAAVPVLSATVGGRFRAF